MPITMKAKQARAQRRAKRTRARVRGTQARPRLTVKRSLKHVYAQLIDDTAGKTLASASDATVSAKGTGDLKPLALAKLVGAALAEKAKTVGINAVVFDRGSYRYHGRVAALADGAREGGLQF